MSFTEIVSYASEDAARVAEICLAHGHPEAIPRYLRAGVLPEVLERELATVATVLRGEAKPVRGADIDRDLEEAAAARFVAQQGGG